MRSSSLPLASVRLHSCAHPPSLSHLRAFTDPKTLAYRMMLKLSDHLAVQRKRAAAVAKEAEESAAVQHDPEGLSATTEKHGGDPGHAMAAVTPEAKGAGASDAGAASPEEVGAFTAFSRWCRSTLTPPGRGENGNNNEQGAGGSSASLAREKDAVCV
jgi:hypothetical protein